MSGRELVGALVRTAGLGLLLVSVIGAAYAAMRQVGSPMPPGYGFQQAILGSALYALFGCLLIAFAPELTRFAYLRDPPDA